MVSDTFQTRFRNVRHVSDLARRLLMFLTGPLYRAIALARRKDYGGYEKYVQQEAIGETAGECC
jgi:hypothetical protein